MSTPPNNERSSKKWLKEKFRSVFSSSRISNRNHDSDGLVQVDNFLQDTSSPSISPLDSRIVADRTGSGE